MVNVPPFTKHVLMTQAVVRNKNIKKEATV